MKNLFFALFLSVVSVASLNAQNTFTLQTVTGAPQGGPVTVALSTTGMTNVGAISLFISYNNTNLAFQDITIVMPEASGTLANAMTSPSRIGISWLATGMSGVNFPSGTILTVNFRVLNCNNTALDFLPSCEVVDWDGNNISISYTNGSVQVNNPASTNWTGTVSTDWFVSGNWTNGVPGCSTDVFISPAANISVLSSLAPSVQIYNLIIYPGGALTVNSTLIVDNNMGIASDITGTGSLIENGTVTVSGLTTVERYYPSPTWHLVSSPVTNAVSAMYNGMYLQKYSETTGNWTDIIPDNEPLIPGQGYALWVNTPYATSYIGPVNSGIISTPVTTTQLYGWNLAGNPYPSSIDWDLVAALNPNIYGAVYYLDAATGNYLSYNGGMGGGSRYAPPMQGFFVSAANPGVFTVNNSIRTHMGASNYYKTDFSHMLVLHAEGNGFSDQAYLRFDAEASAEFEGQYDAYKMLGNSNPLLPQIYTRPLDTKLSINVMQSKDMVAAGFIAGNSGVYTISVTDVTDIDYLLLEDVVTGIKTDLLKGNYTFGYDLNDNPDRFQIHFKALGIGEPESENVRIYGSAGNVYIHSVSAQEGQAVVFTLTGQKLATCNIHKGLNTLSLDYSGQVVVRYTSNNEVVTGKVSLQQ